MVKRTGRFLGIFAAAATVVGASAALAADDGVVPVRAVARAASEVAVQGITPQQFFDNQRALHEWLTGQTPAGTEKAAVSVALSEQDRLDISTPSIVDGVAAPMRVGVVKALSARVGLQRGQALGGRAKTASSVLRRAADGGFVWATTVTAADAVALRVHFEDFSLPTGAAAFFFSREGEAYGPYTGTGPDGSGEFWSNSLASSTGIVLVRYDGPVTKDELRDVSVRITEVAHVAIDFPKPQVEGGIAAFCTFNAACVENNSCVNEPAVTTAESAVAKMRWIGGAFVNICSGGLIADTDSGSQIPYFLTANHCINKGKDAKNLECYFQYSVSCGTSICAGSFDPAPSPSTLGATIVENSTSGDFSLLELKENPPFGSTFLGWNSAPIAFTDGATLHRVSHPSGAPLAYSRHAVDAGATTCQSWPRGERIYSADVIGATEGGSSGSPVLNAAGEIVGQLSGCCGFNCGDVCDTASNSTVDGAFAGYFSLVEPFLDPQGSGGGCGSNAECDDGAFCNGAETCSGGSCQGGSDPCPGQGCDEANDVCTGGGCGGNKAACSSNADCCSGNCKRGTCKGG